MLISYPIPTIPNNNNLWVILSLGPLWVLIGLNTIRGKERKVGKLGEVEEKKERVARVLTGPPPEFALNLDVVSWTSILEF